MLSVSLSTASGNLQWLAMPPEDKDDLKEKLQSLQGNTGRARQPADGEFRHTDMEQAHQHILYLETKVRAMEELDSGRNSGKWAPILRWSRQGVQIVFGPDLGDVTLFILPNATNAKEKRNETLQRQVRDLQKEKQQQQGGCEIS